MRRSDADVVPSTQAEVVRLNEAAVGAVRAERVVANRTTHAPRRCPPGGG